MTADEAYLKIVEGWLREWRTIVFPRGAIDDLCERITMVMQEAADEIERLRLYKEKNESLLIAAAGEQQAEVERLHADKAAISQTASDYLHEIAELESWIERNHR